MQLEDLLISGDGWRGRSPSSSSQTRRFKRLPACQVQHREELLMHSFISCRSYTLPLQFLVHDARVFEHGSHPSSRSLYKGTTLRASPRKPRHQDRQAGRLLAVIFTVHTSRWQKISRHGCAALAILKPKIHVSRAPSR